MIRREIEGELHRLMEEYPLVTLLGPRQAGKTTLARQALPEHAYVNLERPDVRRFAIEDPRAFLERHRAPLILDEIQHVPELLSYLQVEVDARPGNGLYVLTGSHQLSVREAISQSLAGRTAMLHLLPFSISELAAHDEALPRMEDYLHQGFLPRIYDQKQRPTPAWSNYYQTYVERDVRQLINLKDAQLFEKFMRLLAGRAGQLANHASLASDVGVSATTIQHWLSILEASFIVYRLPPYFENFGKRTVKSPKYYFTDVGLLSFLLGIETPDQAARDPLIGPMFENMVVMEVIKQFYNQGKLANAFFYRESNGLEADLLIEQGRALRPIEVKSSATYRPELLKNLQRVMDHSPRMANPTLIYAGDSLTFSNGVRALRFDQIHELMA